MAASGRWKKAALLALLLGLLGLVGWWMTGQVMAWRHYRAGVRALDQDDPAEARRHLGACVRVWRTSGEAHFLLARAARRCGEMAEAVKHLDLAREHGWVADMILLERALLAVQTGDTGPVKYLNACLTANHPDAALILEVLTPAYLRNFQLNEAEWCVMRWLEIQPDRALAWNSKAILAFHRRNNNEAIKSYREEVRLDPSRHRSRLELVKLLIERNQPAEAGEHIAVLNQAIPDDLEVVVQEARWRERLGQREEAAQLLRRVLARLPDHVTALHLRGRLALDAKRPEEAETFLRRAVALKPFEPDLLYTWLRCLQQLGKGAEAREVQDRHRQCEADLKRLADLTEQVRLHPDRPGPRREVAEIYFRNGQDEEGMRWLQTALRIAPDHAPTHRTLADYYDRKGQRHLAAAHRARAGGEVSAKP